LLLQRPSDARRCADYRIPFAECGLAENRVLCEPLARCSVARTLDLIGERWTILILRDLFVKGPQRFQDFQNSLAGAAPNTISARLKAMEKQGLIERKLYSEHPPRLEYYLTERGKSLGRCSARCATGGGWRRRPSATFQLTRSRTSRLKSP
jgi:DNA-binding HxlR family transcriptional regulator